MLRTFQMPLVYEKMLSGGLEVSFSIDLSVTIHINCIVVRCLINVVYFTACAFIRS